MYIIKRKSPWNGGCPGCTLRMFIARGTYTRLNISVYSMVMTQLVELFFPGQLAFCKKAIEG